MHVVIIGNGIAGVTAAQRVRSRQPGWRITLVSGESDYHYSRPALMYIYMGHMRYADTKPYEDSHWEEQRLKRRRAWVTGIDFDAKRLDLHDKGSISYDKLLLATGSKSNKFGWPGQELPGVQGLYDLRDLKLLYENSRSCKQAVIVGGGLIGIELAEMLHSRGIHVTFLVREDSYWSNVLPAEESVLINGAIRRAGMELRLNTELKEIVADNAGRAGAVVTQEGERIDCQFVGLTAGVSPNIDLVRETRLNTQRGIVVDEGLRTSESDVFAAGDCAEIHRGGEPLIQQVWYTGKMQGEVVGEVMAGDDASYDPGIWYNSAKFLQLEYQTYGDVHAKQSAGTSVYWESDDREHAMRIVHSDGRVIGFNFMGMRARHRVCERWIREGRPLSYVLEHLEEFHFDPELFRRHERAMRAELAHPIGAAGS